jgi:hypothetical protein
MKPLEVLHQWIMAVNYGNTQGLLSLYNPNAVLIPTFSNRILNTPERIQNYFEKLSDREDLSIALHEKTVIVQDIQDPIYTIAGIYNWRFSVDGEILNFEARFTFIVDISSPHPIIHHHSSQIPRTL